MKQLQVVSAVIEKSGRFLLSKRSAWKSSAPGYWCPVSGKIEIGESAEEAAVREVYEEVGVTAKPLRKLCEMDTHDKKGRIHWWLMDLVSGEPTLKNDEHSELQWLYLEEIEKLDKVFPEDIEAYRKLTLNPLI